MSNGSGRFNVSHWETQLAIVTDWYDGPREGLCALASPRRDFWFDVVAEREAGNEPDDRLFVLSDVPIGTVAQLELQLSVLGKASGKVWVPKWFHRDREVLDQLEQALQKARSSAVPSGEVFLSRNMLDFAGLWEVQDIDSVTDWFGFLGLD